MVDSEKPKTKLVNTQVALAEALHLSRSRITAYRKHPMWKFVPPFDVETVRLWIAAYIKVEHGSNFARYARVAGTSLADGVTDFELGDQSALPIRLENFFDNTSWSMRLSRLRPETE